MVLSHHLYDWYHNVLTNAAFGFVGPGMYSSFSGWLQQTTAGRNLFSAGVITCTFHGWIVASFNSARMAVHQMLSAQLLQLSTEKHSVKGDQDVLEESEQVDSEVELKKKYIRRLIKRLEKNWTGNDFEPEPQTDDNLTGIVGW